MKSGGKDEVFYVLDETTGNPAKAPRRALLLGKSFPWGKALLANHYIAPQTLVVTNVTICYQEGIKSVVHLTREADYGLRLLLEAGAAGGAFVTTRSVSKRQKIPYHFLRRAATVLAAKGLLTTSRGPLGGVRLARPASEISLLDVVNAFGGLSLNDCTDVPTRCARTKVCPAFPAWVEAQTAVDRALAGTKLDGLLRVQKPRHGPKVPSMEHACPEGASALARAEPHSDRRKGHVFRRR